MKIILAVISIGILSFLWIFFTWAALFIVTSIGALSFLWLRNSRLTGPSDATSSSVKKPINDTDETENRLPSKPSVIDLELAARAHNTSSSVDTDETENPLPSESSVIDFECAASVHNMVNNLGSGPVTQTTRGKGFDLENNEVSDDSMLSAPRVEQRNKACIMKKPIRNPMRNPMMHMESCTSVYTTEEQEEALPSDASAIDFYRRGVSAYNKLCGSPRGKTFAQTIPGKECELTRKNGSNTKPPNAPSALPRERSNKVGLTIQPRRYHMMGDDSRGSVVTIDESIRMSVVNMDDEISVDEESMIPAMSVVGPLNNDDENNEHEHEESNGHEREEYNEHEGYNAHEEYNEDEEYNISTMD